MKKIDLEKEAEKMSQWVSKCWESTDDISKEISDAWQIALNTTSKYMVSNHLYDVLLPESENLMNKKDELLKNIGIKLSCNVLRYDSTYDWNIETEISKLKKALGKRVKKEYKDLDTKGVVFGGVDSSDSAVNSFEYQIKNARYGFENHNESYAHTLASAIFSHAAFCNSINNAVNLKRDINKASKNPKLFFEKDKFDSVLKDLLGDFFVRKNGKKFK